MPTIAQVEKTILQNQFHPVYLLHGEEPYYIDSLAASLEQNVLSEQEKSFNLSILYGKDVNAKTIMDHVGQFPMMSSHRLVIIREAQHMKDLVNLASYVKDPMDSTILVICYKYKKVDGRSAFFKAFKSNKSTVIFESKKLYDNQVPNWIENHVKSLGYGIGQNAIMQLAQNVGTDIANIKSEVKKLTLNLSAGATISPDDIEKYIGVSKTFNVFELQRAIGTKNQKAVYNIIYHFEANPNSHPLPMIIGLLYGFFVKLYIAAQNQGVPDGSLMKLMGLKSTYFVREYRFAVSKYSVKQIRNVLLLLSEYDLKSKGVNSKSVPPMSLLREMVYKMME